MKVIFSLDEMQNLFVAAGNYGRTSKSEVEKGGEWWAEKVGREDDVVGFFAKMRKIARKKGPGDYIMGPETVTADVKAKWTKELALSEEDRDAITWLGVAAMDPRSPDKATVGLQVEIWKPILEKVKRLQFAKKELKLDDRKRIAIPDDKFVPKTVEESDAAAETEGEPEEKAVVEVAEKAPVGTGE